MTTPTASGSWLPASLVLAACERYQAAAVEAHKAQRFAAITRLAASPPWWAPWRGRLTLLQAAEQVGPVLTWDELRRLQGLGADRRCHELLALAQAAYTARRPVWVTAEDAATLAGCWLAGS